STPRRSKGARGPRPALLVYHALGVAGREGPGHLCRFTPRGPGFSAAGPFWSVPGGEHDLHQSRFAERAAPGRHSGPLRPGGGRAVGLDPMPASAHTGAEAQAAPRPLLAPDIAFFPQLSVARGGSQGPGGAARNSGPV